MRGQDIADPPIKTLHHAVGLRMARTYKSVFNTMLCTSDVEGMMPGWLALTSRSESIREAFAIIGQHLANLEGCLADEMMEKGPGITCRLAGADLQVDPTRCPVDSDVQIASSGLIGHLRQVLDIDVHKPWFVVLEGLVAGGCVTLGIPLGQR